MEATMNIVDYSIDEANGEYYFRLFCGEYNSRRYGPHANKDAARAAGDAIKSAAQELVDAVGRTMEESMNNRIAESRDRIWERLQEQNSDLILEIESLKLELEKRKQASAKARG